jgi:hypothetical protein
MNTHDMAQSVLEEVSQCLCMWDECFVMEYDEAGNGEINGLTPLGQELFDSIEDGIVDYLGFLKESKNV